MENIKIQVKNVSKKFKMYNSSKDKLVEAFDPLKRVRHTEFAALTDISFDVEEGEIIGIVGRNGSGKSTLLKIITGILNPTTGEVKVSGRISSLLELGTGFNMEYTGIDNIYFYGTLMGLKKSEIDSRLNDIIEFAEIGDYIGQVVKTYSSGMFARLAFSCAINVDPDILIVDEILSVGDMRFQAKCFNKFKEFKKRGVTILYVGHDVGMMRTFCDRCIWLNNGQMVADGEPVFITSKYTEFMYADDESDFTEYKKFDANTLKEVSEKKEENVDTIDTNEDGIDEVLVEQSPDNDAISNVEIGNRVVEGSIFPNALAHWGSNVGMIQKLVVSDMEDEKKNIFEADERIKIQIFFHDELDFDHKNLSVAFSIKNKEGTDLIVKTTYDEKIEIQEGLNHVLTFEFLPMLATGEYYLVIAIENRENMNPTYFEYVEGAYFFKIYSKKKIFGLFDVEANIRDEVEND